MRTQWTCSFYLLAFYFEILLAESPSVVIIGAGASGIAAATKLLENSIINVTILEAQNRIGGRIYSTTFENTFVDLGAQYCHGQEGNIVYEMVKDLDLLEHTKTIDSEYSRVYTSDGNIVDANLTQDLYEWIFSYSELTTTSNSTSLKDAFLESYNKTLISKYQNDRHKFKIMKDAITFLEKPIVIYEGTYSWDRVSTKSHFVESPGDPNLVWKKKGYHIILDVLTKSYPNPSEKLPIDDKILLNKEVTKINWNDTRVTVQTTDKSSITADHVIFTPSIGILKKGDLFDPQLPKEKLDAIEAIGFDAVMKILIHFPNKWWKDDDQVFLFLWTQEDLDSSSQQFSEGPTKDGISWVASIPVLAKISEKDNVFLMWVSGHLIPQIETTPEDVLLRGCNFIVKKFLGKNYNVTDADKLLRSQWSTNTYVRGSYSFERAGYYKEDFSYQEKLSEPLVNRNGRPTLLFAGEATNRIHHSTVHGAIETGRREAERIINFYKL